MPFVAIPDVVQLQAIHLWEGQWTENVYHYYSVAAKTAANLHALGTAWRTDWLANIQPLLPSAASLQKLIITDLSSQSGVSVEHTDDMPVAGGSSSSPSLPNNVTVAIKWLTALRGRSYRGRTYHMGICDDGVTGNVISTALRNALTSAYEQITQITDAIPNEWFLVVASRYANGVARNPGIYTYVTDVFVDTIVDSQRRRLPGRGN